MGITGYDISILPGLIFFGVLLIPILFLISFIFNLLVLWLILRFDKMKIKASKILLPVFTYTILVGIIEVALLFVSYAIARALVLSAFLYGIFSFVAIFLVFKMFIPRFIKVNMKKMNKYALIMSIVTNPGFMFFVIIFLLYGILRVAGY